MNTLEKIYSCTSIVIYSNKIMLDMKFLTQIAF
jgi:hypothetical protein